MPIETYAKVEKADRLPVSMQGFMKRVRDFKVGAPKDPDLKKLQAAMNGKPAVCTIAFDKNRFSADCTAGAVKEVVVSFDVSTEKDRARRRKLLENISAVSTLVGNADLAAFDKANPDPAKVAAAKAELDRVKFDIQRDLGFLKTRPKNFRTMNGGEQEVGFTHWCEGKNYDRYPTFALWVEWGRDPAAINDEFVKADAKRPIKLSDAARKEVADALAAGRKPTFAKSKAEVLKVLDTILVPLYNKDVSAGLKKNIEDNKKLLAKKLKAWKDAGGK